MYQKCVGDTFTLVPTRRSGEGKLAVFEMEKVVVHESQCVMLNEAKVTQPNLSAFFGMFTERT
jgi:hypothetical protein